MIRWSLGIWFGAMLTAVAAAELDGRLEWARKVTLSVPVSGVVEEVTVSAGERVESGRVLFRLDPRPFQNGVASARAKLDRVLPAREEAQRELERAEELYERTVLSEHERQLARIALARADAEQRVAESALAQAELELGYSVVRSPFDALVLETRVEVGQTVVTRYESVPLITVVEAGRLLARAEVSLERVAGLKAGDIVSIRLHDRRYQGRFRRVVPEPSAWVDGEPRYPIEVAVSAPTGERLYAGQRVIVELP